MMQPYWLVFRLSARASIVNWRTAGTGVLLTMVRITLYTLVYWAAYRTGRDVGFSLQKTIASLTLFFMFNINLGMRDIFRVISPEVRSGDIAVQLLRPISWRATKICQVLGANSVQFVALLVIMPLYLFALVRWPALPPMTPGFILGYVMLTILGVINSSLLYVTVGLAAFWLQDTLSLWRVLDRLVFIFGGGFVPVALLPWSMQQAMRFSPLGVVAAPTQLFYAPLQSIMVPYLAAGLFWTAAMYGVSTYVWAQARRRLEVNGG